MTKLRRITPDTIVFGDIEPVLFAFRKLGVPLPTPQPYPLCLQEFFQRKITLVRLCDFPQWIVDHPDPCFVKPADSFKSFTGFVFSASYQFGKLAFLPPHHQLYVSTVVRFQSEWRVYVMHGKILGIYWYCGDVFTTLDRNVVNRAVQIYETETIDPMHGYAIDFGVSEDGQTLLVELNEGFSIGNYGLDDADYANLLTARWLQLVHSAKH